MKAFEVPFLHLLILIALIAPAYSAEPQRPQQGETLQGGTADIVGSLRRELKETKDALEAVRRDQLNYRIEKDLLKETYTSNLQTINIVITIVLGTFTVVGFILGFLGVRSITSLRDTFRQELDKLLGLRSHFEQKLTEIVREQEQAKSKFEELTKINEQQNTRLQVLEIQEKAQSLLNQKNYTRALEYIAPGLRLEPNDLILLQLQTDCLLGLYRFPEALRVCEKRLEIEPSAQGVIATLAELYLLVDRLQDFDTFYEVNKSIIAERDPLLPWYLESLRLFRSGDLEGLRRHLDTGLKDITPDIGPRIANWRFLEARSMIRREPDSPAKMIMLRVLDFLEGKLAASALRKTLE